MERIEKITEKVIEKLIVAAILYLLALLFGIRLK